MKKFVRVTRRIFEICTYIFWSAESKIGVGLQTKIDYIKYTVNFCKKIILFIDALMDSLNVEDITAENSNDKSSSNNVSNHSILSCQKIPLFVLVKI